MATKKPGTALTLWEQEMKTAAVKHAEAEKSWGGLKRIGTTGGIMTVDDERVEGNSLDVVVLGSVHLNEYYNTAYDAQRRTVPTCYAIGDETLDDPEASMAPTDDVEDKQGDDNGLCTNCWANAMGSANTGRGKACRNSRRLVVMTEDNLESADALEAAEERTLGIPVTSVRAWVKYVKEVLAEKLQRPYYGVVTTISLEPDLKTQFRMNFTFKALVNFDQELWAAMQAKVKTVGVSIVAPYPKQADLDAAAQTAKPLRPVGKAAQMMNKGKAQAPAAKPPAKKAAGKKY